MNELSDEEKEMISGNNSKRARADIAIMDYSGAQKCSYFDVSIISPICDTHKDSSVEKLLSKIERKKNDLYAKGVRNHLGSDFYPIILTSGGALGPMAKKLIKDIANKLSRIYQTKAFYISQIKNDLSISLIKSRVSGLRANRNNIISQLNDLRSLQYTCGLDI